MNNAKDPIWDSASAQQLATALTIVDDQQLMQDFLRDVMTEKEIVELGARLEAARLLLAGKSYALVSQKTKLSSRTIARISEWLKNGTQGYQTVLALLTRKALHIPPVDAD